VAGIELDYGAGAIHFFTEASAAHTAGNSFDEVANEAMTIEPSGDVGIGVTAPQLALHVSSGTHGFLLGVDATANGYTALAMKLSAQKDGYAELQSVKSAGTSYGDLILNKSGGNVGIGTTDPGEMLEVNGTVKATALSGSFDTSSSKYIRIGDMQISWGTTGVISDGGSEAVSFPQAYNEVPSVVVASVTRNGLNCGAGGNGTDSRTTSGFTMEAQSGGTNKCSWVAIGTWQ